MALKGRFIYDPGENAFFITFEALSMRRLEDIERVRHAMEERIAPLGRKLPAIVNCDNLMILPELLDDYSDMVADLMECFYAGVRRYSASPFCI
jgi:propionate CoA-transferase